MTKTTPETTSQYQRHLKIAWIAVALQFLVALILTFGDIGFDRPGKFGLSFGHFLVVAILALVAFIIGLTMAAWARSSVAIAAVIFGAVLCIVSVIVHG